jgi:hypothetical protein
MGKIIGIAGKIGSGKDTLADFIIKELELQNKKTERRFFANLLKEMHKQLTGFGGWTQEEKNVYLDEVGFTVGEGLQKIGDGLRQLYHPLIWIISALRNLPDDAVTIVTDVRYPNEVDYIKQAGGAVIRLEGDPAKIRENSKRDLNHSSEIALDDYRDWDVLYENNKGFTELENFAKKIVKVFCS